MVRISYPATIFKTNTVSIAMGLDLSLEPLKSAYCVDGVGFGCGDGCGCLTSLTRPNPGTRGFVEPSQSIKTRLGTRINARLCSSICGVPETVELKLDQKSSWIPLQVRFAWKLLLSAGIYGVMIFGEFT